MDIHVIMNTDGGGAGRDGSKAAHPRPHHPPPPAQSISTSAVAPVPAAPATPVQAAPPPPPHPFRDYNHSAHASPVSQPREYPPGHLSYNPSAAGPGPVPYASPTSYHHPSPGGPYAGRPSAPALQPLAPQDVRSPGSASLSGPSPYRPTPTPSASVSSTGGYPFPAAQPPASPVQRHQYGSSDYPRDPYPSQQVVSAHGSVSYPQGQPQQQQQQQQQSIPLTPPVATPGGSHQYLHQRSLSIHSTPTPNSVHSQHPPYPPSYAQGSPVAARHPPPTQPDQQHHRHQSPQPATPLGPPMAAPLRQSPAMSYQQPPSPYQQRMPSTSGSYQQMMKTSPPPPPPASIHRMSSSGHSESQRRSQSQQSRSERERSLSVSPKTRVPSLPSSAGQSASNEQDAFHSQQRLQPHPPPSSVAIAEFQHDMPPAKRKIGDRDLRPDEVENQRQPPPPPRMNGNHALPSQQPSTSPTMPRGKRATHGGPPVWAQSGRKRTPTSSRNFSIKHGAVAPSSAGSVNGTHHEPGAGIKTEHASRHTSPETARSTAPPREETGQAASKDSLTFGGQPFPWEPTIEASKPIDFVSRAVADFFVFNVLNGPNPAELRARGAQFEIEAKLGTIIDKSTNDRIELRVQAGECIIGEGARIAFRSSMTENQHRVLNEYLNEQVKASLYPRTSTSAPRVPIQYVHRRQTDRFFELPSHLRQRLPPTIANLLSSNNAPLKARVTYDQKTGNVLAKIVKARVADLHIHMAHLPLDCRISINIEWDWDGPPQEIEKNQIPNKDRQPDRNKDRLSYTHGFYQIDLTQVTQSVQGPQGQAGLASKEHELEIELESRVLYEHGHLLMKGEPNRYSDLVDGFVDNVRMLAKRCPQPTY